MSGWWRWAFAAVALIISVTSSTTTSLGLSRDEGRQLSAQHPDWLLPPWTAGGPAAWTIVGPPYGGTVTVIGADGSFAPRNHGPSISLWLFDLDEGRLYTPAEHSPLFHLDEDSLPIVTGSWDLDDLHIETTFFTSWPASDLTPWFAGRGEAVENAVTFMRVQVTTSASKPRLLAVYLALRPIGVEPDVHPITSASCDPGGTTLTADGNLVLEGLQPADGCGATSYAPGELSTFAIKRRLPPGASVTDSAQRAEAALRVRVNVSSESPGRFELRVPLSDHALPPDPGNFDAERQKVAAAWRAALSRVTLELPDSRLNAAFLASQAYLLLNRRANLPRSGPLAHDAFWVRDAAYIGEALERIGASDDNQATLDALLAAQRDDGSFAAITDSTGRRPVDEWDGPGEVIASVVSHYRFTHDRAWLERAYPRLLRAAQFLDDLRGRTLAEGPETKSLLPANASAEDLGPPTWHHYWDDLWAISGYREAGFAASELGRGEDVGQLLSRADDLQAAMLRSVELVQERTGADVIPNGPEDALSSAMARGTTPALWPVRAFSGSAPGDLLARSFHAYFAAFLAPQSGGYRHYQHTLWPYGGLGIAHAMLRLGMLAELQQVLAWTLDHQTLPGTYAWGEAINPRNGGLELGDMPHSWAAAELISVLRDMLLSENDGWLDVNPGGLDTWLDPGKRVALHAAPTHYGLVDVELTRLPADPLTGAADLRIVVSGYPPNGWRVRVPGSSTVLTLGPGPHDLTAHVGDAQP